MVTLGMLTLDDILFDSDQNPTSTEHLLGGAGTYAVVGARIVAGKQHAQGIGWVVHAGHDLPLAVKDEIDSWTIRTKYIITPERPTTRAKNVYSGEHRSFEFTSPKIHVDHTMLSRSQLEAKVFHIIGTSSRCISLVEGLLGRRGVESPSLGRPRFVWEPMEHECCPDNIPNFMRAMNQIDVFSPNEIELMKLFGFDLSDSTPDYRKSLDRFLSKTSSEVVENCNLLAFVVRLGARGACVTCYRQVTGPGPPIVTSKRIPAYHASGLQFEGTSELVVDVTGGGNAFLGAYCHSLANSIPPAISSIMPEWGVEEVAALYGSVAASYVIEQVGMPQVSYSPSSTSYDQAFLAPDTLLKISRKVVTSNLCSPVHLLMLR